MGAGLAAGTIAVKEDVIVLAVIWCSFALGAALGVAVGAMVWRTTR